MYWFMILDWILLVIVVGLLSVIQTYMQLHRENYRWWWRSFWTGASGGIYLSIYSVVYLIDDLDLNNFDSDVVYLVYMWLIISCYMLIMGTLSVFSSYVLVEHLYKSK